MAEREHPQIATAANALVRQLTLMPPPENRPRTFFSERYIRDVIVEYLKSDVVDFPHINSRIIASSVWVAEGIWSEGWMSSKSITDDMIAEQFKTRNLAALKNFFKITDDDYLGYRADVFRILLLIMKPFGINFWKTAV